MIEIVTTVTTVTITMTVIIIDLIAERRRVIPSMRLERLAQIGWGVFLSNGYVGAKGWLCCTPTRGVIVQHKPY